MIDIQTPAGTRAKVYMPPDYDGTKKFPLMVFLHGIGEKSDTNLELVLRNGTPKLIANGTDFPFVMIAPQLKRAMSNWSVPYTDEVIEYALKTYDIDPTRIWLVGLSLGGYGVWMYMQSAQHAAKIAAFVPICGGGNDPTKAHVIVASRVPGWAWHCPNDATVPIERTIRMVTAVNQLAGYEQIKFFSACANGHSAWVPACDPKNGLYDWLAFQRRPGKLEPVTAIDIVDGNRVRFKTAAGDFYGPVTR
jgi:predicted peptidase